MTRARMLRMVALLTVLALSVPSLAIARSGPISKGQLFFFADYQGSRQDAPGFGTASVGKRGQTPFVRFT